MRAMTEPSSFGWDPKKKKKELFHRNARFILLYACESDPQNGEAPTPIAAFSTFRFERDQGEDVLYCYELQVAENFRGSGLGRFLIDSLTAIGQHYHMEKIMLTVLKCNEAARLFYARTGFTMDPSSPDYRSTSQDDGLRGVEKHIEESCDYEILAKALL
ncbi:hypothetical protein BN946_scf184868.g53 [Trametes cinnabarina]|uniref:N-alpha-acetyltransferase 40 n=1 Tax=Pycnoporus cinnabarinus TaxID=5643 RepID=A0A060SWN3_PYCCI|nr:hypothetical protein BN946_scf184868.g53 [Trametes cinnabarina]